MHIAVCVKEIIDPELAPGDFEIDPDSPKVVESHAARVLSPFDENALELALQIKDEVPDTQVTVVSLGREQTRDALRKTLACGADQAILIQVVGEWRDYDSNVTAAVLEKVLKGMGPLDAVLCGRQAGDWDAGQVGYLLAERLAMPCISIVNQIRWSDGGWLAEREVGEGIQHVRCSTSFLATVTNTDKNQLRLPKVRDVMQARRKPLEVVEVAAGEAAHGQSRLKLRELIRPENKKHCIFIEGDTGEKLGHKLAEHLFDQNIL